MWVPDLKGSQSNNEFKPVIWIDVIDITEESGRADSTSYSTSAPQYTTGVRGGRAAQDYTGVIGALFERIGLKLELVDRCRPQCRLTGLTEKAEEEYRLKLTLEACSQ